MRGAKKFSKGKSGSGASDRALKPRQISPNLIVRHRYRFSVKTAAIANVVTSVSAMHMCGYAAVTATSGYAIFANARIKEIEVWAPPASQGAASTCTVTWIGSSALAYGVSNVEASDSSVSTAFPAHVRTSPPVRSFAAEWFGESVNSNLCTIIAPVGSIIDVDVEMVLGDGSAAGSVLTVAGASVGSIYYAPLDANTLALSQTVPVGLSSL